MEYECQIHKSMNNRFLCKPPEISTVALFNQSVKLLNEEKHFAGKTSASRELAGLMEKRTSIGRCDVFQLVS